MTKLARLLFVSGFAVLSVSYLSAVSDYWKITADSTSYVLAGKSLAEGDGYLIRGRAVHLRPPVPALIYAGCFLVSSGHYFWHNLAVSLLAVLAAWLSYLVLREEFGRLRGGVLALLVFASVQLFRESTFLLSDVIYTAVSLATLFLLGRQRPESLGWKAVFWLGLWAFVACMTRPNGVMIPLAVLGCAFATCLREKRWKPTPLVWVMGAVLSLTVLWEVRNVFTGWSFAGLFLQNEPWVKDSGRVSPFGLVGRFIGNLDDYLVVGRILTNDANRHLVSVDDWLSGAVLASFSLLFAFGLLVSMRRGLTINNVYTLLFVLSAGLYHPRIQIRWLLPVVPFVFCYGWVGLEWFALKARPVFGRAWTVFSRAALVGYVTVYFASAVYYMSWVIPSEHESPFSDSRIKYAYNYDAQRLALWIRDNSDPTDGFVVMHPEIFEGISERRAFYPPLSSDGKRFLSLVESEARIRYVLMDKEKRLVKSLLLPLIAANPERFELRQDAERAAVYEVKRAE